MPLHPMVLMLTLAALTAAAYIIARAISVQRQKTMKLVANRLDWHYTQFDRFGLLSRLRATPPIVSPADMTVSHVAHRRTQGGQSQGDSGTLQYVVCVEFTTGAANRLHRRRILASITEVHGSGQCSVRYHPCCRLIQDYQELIVRTAQER